MLRELAALYTKCRDFDRVEELAAFLASENERLLLENVRLRKENRYLRHKLREHELRTLRRAEVDANLIGLLWLVGSSTSRRSCLAYGISRRRWAWARALLRAAYILDDEGWTVDDPAAFETRLSAGVRRVESRGLETLRGHMPRNGYAGARHSRRVR